VRHAEKEAATTMTIDVPLTAAGSQNSIVLKDRLKSKHIRHIFSTNYNRTKATAQPLSETTGVPVTIYNPGDTAFVTRLKSIHKGNVLIVGHSNTVDDLVNGLTGQKHLQDLPDTEYGDLFIVKRKGKNYLFSKSHFGK
jgi:broad specificity phosphatase PhoE